MSTLFFAAVLLFCFFLPQTVLGAELGYVTIGDLNVRTRPSSTNSEVVGTLSYELVTILGSEQDENGDTWYKISYEGYERYVFAEYVRVSSDSGSEETEETSSMPISPETIPVSPETVPESTASDYGSFEDQLSQFPITYRSLIQEIHEAYPNYIFQADYVSMSYDEAVYQETLDHRKLVSMDYDGVSWRSLSPSCYDRRTGTWSTFSGNWTDAAVDVIEYYMDPRNFLTVRHMYIFAQQTYTGSETRSGVESIVGDSFLGGYYTDSTGTHNYIDTIMQVAAESNVSPYVIAATLRIEQPYSGDSPLIDGSYGYYNFFNFAASGSDVVGNGIAYAKQQGWDTVYKSILGGAQGYYNGYLKYGQDTYFYKDYNVITGDFDHQYAQGAYDQIGSASFLREAIGGDTEATLVLRIPVYTSMPEEIQTYPPETNSLNTRYTADGLIVARKTTTIDTPGEPGEEETTVPAQVPDASEPSGGSASAGGDSSSSSGGNGGQGGEDASSTSKPDNPGGGAASPKYRAGDANGDDKLSALDYVAVKNHLLGKSVITDSEKLKAADANGDGKISALDYVWIKNTILGH